MLVTDEPGLCCAELLWVDEDETPGLSKGLQHKRRQPGDTESRHDTGYYKGYLTTKNFGTRADKEDCGRLGNVDELEDIDKKGGRGGMGKRGRHGLQLWH